MLHLGFVHSLVGPVLQDLFLLFFLLNAFFCVCQDLLNDFLGESCQVKLEVSLGLSGKRLDELSHNSNLAWSQFWEMVGQKLCLLRCYVVDLGLEELLQRLLLGRRSWLITLLEIA